MRKRSKRVDAQVSHPVAQSGYCNIRTVDDKLTPISNEVPTSSQPNIMLPPERLQNTPWKAIPDSEGTTSNRPDIMPPSHRSQNKPRDSIPPSEIRSTDIVILVLGTTGSGMSNFINVLTGMRPEDGAHAYISCTEDVIAYPYYRGAQRYVFVDTPGFSPILASQKVAFEKIAEWLAATYRETRLQFNGVIYIRRITETRRSRFERTSFRICANLIGNEAAHRVRLVTTMWDDPQDGSGLSAGVDRENRLKEEQWGSLINEGAMCERFLNTPESAWDIVHGLGVEKKESLLIQRELVDMRTPLRQTTAGMEFRESSTSLGVLLKRLYGL